MRHRHVEDDAFAEFYVLSKDRCLRAAVAYGMTHAAAEEAVAEAFARAYASWATVRHHDSPAAWVVRTAINADISWWRRRHEARWREPRDDDLATIHQGSQPVTEASVREEVLDAMTAVRSLPRRQREVVILRHLLDLDTAMTASVLGIAAGTVTAHLYRAHVALRAALLPADPDRAKATQGKLQ